MTEVRKYKVHQIEPHEKQLEFINSKKKRKIIRAGRRGGKTCGIAYYAVEEFLAGHRVLYAAPTQDQVGAFWFEVTAALWEPIEAGVFYKNETNHVIESPGTKTRIRAKTAWSADTLRGDYADRLIFDEWQLMNESAWEMVGAPMLLDNNGDAVFIYTPPSPKTRSVSKADDPMHAAKLFKKAQENPDWGTFHFTSFDNPYISKVAIEDLKKDMTSLAYRMEIMAEDIDDNPSAVWKRDWIEENRVLSVSDLDRVVVGVDPSATKAGDECGIVIVGGKLIDAKVHTYTLADESFRASPKEWASRAVWAYYKHEADCIVAESNQGGEMVSETIATVDPNVPVYLVHASRGKAIRAEPISAIYEQGRGHHVGVFENLEDEMCMWQPGMTSPNRMDALVWAATDILQNYTDANMFLSVITSR